MPKIPSDPFNDTSLTYFKYVCPKCGDTKIVKPYNDPFDSKDGEKDKGLLKKIADLDPLNLQDSAPVCKKCQAVMEKREIPLGDALSIIYK